jgi:hypothetical protein
MPLCTLCTRLDWAPTIRRTLYFYIAENAPPYQRVEGEQHKRYFGLVLVDPMLSKMTRFNLKENYNSKFPNRWTVIVYLRSK